MNRHPTAVELPRRVGFQLTKFVTRACVGFGALCMMLSVVYEEGETEALLSNGALLVGMAALSAWVAHVQKEVPFRIFQILLWLAMLQPLSLLLATLIEGDVIYSSSLGVFSHHDGAAFIAGAYALFYASAVLAWSLINVRRQVWKIQFTEMIKTLPDLSLLSVILLAAGLVPARLATSFDLGVPVKLLYFLRVYLSLFTGAVFFLGVALRRSQHRLLTYPVAAALMAIYVILLLGGNRYYFVEGSGLLVFGFLTGAPTKRKVWMAATAVMFVCMMGAMYVGEVLRTSDDLGRSGDAALSRIDDFGERIQTQTEDITVRQSSLRRVLRNSTHAVMTMVPDYMPHEEVGLINIFGEFARRILPGFNYSGHNENKLLRNYMLNDLGFLVNEQTSFELALVPDAWYRAGYWGLVLIGLFLGVLVGVSELIVLSLLKAIPEMQLFFVFSIGSIWLIEGRDIVWGFRTFFHSLVATFLFALSIYVMRAFILVRNTRLGDAQTTSMNARNVS